jgi:hypothetical protein
MSIILITLGYLRWHYGRAILSLTRIWGNFLFFLREYFSLRQLFFNFFDPWKRMSDHYPSFFETKKFFFALISNLIMRVVGILMRLGLILIGLLAYAGLALLFLPALALWLILPIIILALFGAGIFLIITK